MTDASRETRAKYVIIDEFDAPEPAMVCQWVPNVGYCYLNRSGTKPRRDGMTGANATPIEAFGFDWRETGKGTVCFEMTSRPSTATYFDGMPRRWQSTAFFFEYRRLTTEAVKQGACAVTRANSQTSGWQPIETAPRTNHSLLVWCPERKNIYIVSWRSHTEEWEHFGALGRALTEYPTHWMPLPEPPDAE